MLDKLRQAGTPLGEYVQGQFYYGIKTGFNEAFVVDQATRDRLIAEDASSADVLKPFLRGRDVRRWQVNYQDLWIIFTRRGIDITKYPAIHTYLLQYKKQLTPGIPGGRKAGSYQWYEIQDNIAYWQEFEQPKIVYPNICMQSGFAWDTDGYYANQKTYIIPLDDKYLLAVLNSKPAWEYLKSTCSVLGDANKKGRLELSAIFMEKLPIPKATKKQQAPIVKLVDDILAAKQANPDADVSALEADIDAHVYRLYGLTDEEIRVVAGE